MTSEEFREQLEEALSIRQTEFVFFKNILNEVPPEKKDTYRKVLVLLLYSHFEGFTKIAFLNYINFINSCSILIKDANPKLAALGLERELNAYDNLDKKCSIFKRKLPDDGALHRFSRRADLVDNFVDFQNKPLNIPDSAINTESNLRYIVLQKNLYRIGLPENLFQEFRGQIDALVNRRNEIAHGTFTNGVNEQDLANWESTIKQIQQSIIAILYKCASDKSFLL